MNPNNHDICLNMIVKNEAHVIGKTLENLYNNIKFSYYVICDTGSTDDTVNVIKTFFDSKGIKGEIYIDEWKDFGYNRTLALRRAYKKSKYLFIFDADDEIVNKLVLPSTLDKDGYYLRFEQHLSYKRLLLVNNHIQWAFIGVLHEYITCIEPNRQVTHELIEGEYYLISGKTGDRNKDPDKYLKDAKILENAYNECEKNNSPLKVRYSFYCAQSYRDYGDNENAIIWYKKRAQLGDWDQEVYYSLLMVGALYAKTNEMEKAMYYWSVAYDYDPDRWETVYEIISYFRKLGKTKLAYQYTKMISEKGLSIDPMNKLFYCKQIYEYLLNYELSILLCYNDKHKEGIQIYNKLFLVDTIPTLLKVNILENFAFYVNHLDKDLNFNENFFNFVSKIYKETNEFNNRQLLSIKATAEKIVSLYSNYDLDIIKNNINSQLIQRLPGGLVQNAESLEYGVCERLQNKDKEDKQQNKIRVFLSILNHDNYDLLEKKLNSFLICCKDIILIDYFFCVDENSDIENRNKIKKNYPFLNIYFKNNNEQGKLNSMNIIYEKLETLKPTYWVHLDNNSLFIKPNNYIKKSIDYMEKHQSHNISQICFNKNYAQSVEGYNRKGGITLEDGLLLHSYNDNNETLNSCSKWPHYSFDTSLIKVDSILSLGNYTTTNRFFEKEYAKKYTEQGYKTAFLNEICSINIGN